MPSSLPTLSPITLGDLQTAVLGRLGDSGAVYWSTAEINALIKEALRYWNASTRYWRTRTQFSTVAGTAFYDLSTELSSTLGYTVTDADLVTEMEYHLQEPPTPTAWTGTAMFTLDQLTQALQRRRDQFLVETGAVQTYYTPPVIPNATGRVQLQDSIIDIRRLSWLTSSGNNYPLWRTDEWDMTGQVVDWTTQFGTPQVYSVSVTPPFAVQFQPPPQDPGTLDAIVVNAGAELNPVTPVDMGIPDDWAWCIMWGALADLLGENGPGYDPARAQYCEERWKEGLALADAAATVVQAYWNNLPLQVVTLAELDSLNPTWQNDRGTPQYIAMAGLNIVAISPVPNGVYSVTVDIVQNAPMPAGDSSQILIPRDVADVIVDYSQHVAAFKQVGEEFFATAPLLERTGRLAETYRRRTGAQTPDQRAMFNRGRLQLKEIRMEMAR